MDKRIENIENEHGELVVRLKKGWCIGLGTPLSYSHTFLAKDNDEIKKFMLLIKVCRCHTCYKH